MEESSLQSQCLGRSRSRAAMGCLLIWRNHGTTLVWAEGNRLFWGFSISVAPTACWCILPMNALYSVHETSKLIAKELDYINAIKEHATTIFLVDQQMKKLSSKVSLCTNFSSSFFVVKLLILASLCRVIAPGPSLNSIRGWMWK